MRYDNINALRGLSAIGIVLMHYQDNLGMPLSMGYVSEKLIPWMTNFVLLFFMVSAFGMCCGYYERFKTGDLVPQAFYSKRYGRILPFFSLLCVLDVASSFSWESLMEGFMDCTLVFSLLPNPDIKVIGVGWFLGVIFLFYMLFPYFVFLLDNKRRAWLVLGVVIIINYFCRTYFFTDAFIDFNPGRQNILFSAIFLVVGGMIYLYRNQIYAATSRLGYWSLLICVFITILYFVFPIPIGLGNTLATSLLFFVWLAYAVSPAKGWMTSKTMNFLSAYSMEIYLCHMMVFRAIEKLSLETYFSNPNLLYLVVCVLGLSVATAFSWGAVKCFKKVGL